MIFTQACFALVAAVNALCSALFLPWGRVGVPSDNSTIHFSDSERVASCCAARLIQAPISAFDEA